METSAYRSSPRLLVLLRNHQLLVGLTLGYAALAYGISQTVSHPPSAVTLRSLLGNFAGMVPTIAYLVLLWRFLHATYVVRPESRVTWMKQDIRNLVTSPDRMLSGIFAVCLMFAVLLCFAQLKRFIPLINPFSWDQTFMALDQTLHFGVQPYKIAHAVFGNPLLITAFTGCYNFWALVMYFMLVLTCFRASRPRVRMQFLLAFLLTCFVAGNLLATIYSSAGPAYFARLGYGTVYDPLMQILQAHATTAPISVIEVQDTLWSLYTQKDSTNGISAMPSMHVASTVLVAIYAFSFGRLAGIAASVFAAIIMVGSVLLGWHYAVDGYLGALVAVACWTLAGGLVRSRLGLPEQA